MRRNCSPLGNSPCAIGSKMLPFHPLCAFAANAASLLRRSWRCAKIAPVCSKFKSSSAIEAVLISPVCLFNGHWHTHAYICRGKNRIFALLMYVSRAPGHFNSRGLCSSTPSIFLASFCLQSSRQSEHTAPFIANGARHTSNYFYLS